LKPSWRRGDASTTDAVVEEPLPDPLPEPNPSPDCCECAGEVMLLLAALVTSRPFDQRLLLLTLPPALALPALLL
jgi:hypothetical protein